MIVGASLSVRIVVGCPPMGRRSRCPRRVAQRSRGPPAAVDQEPVVGVGERLDAVEVGGEGERRLRLADRQHPLDAEPVEGIGSPVERRAGPPGCRCRRRTRRRDGAGRRSARGRAPEALAQPGAAASAPGGRDGHLAALDADLLGRHAHPRVALAQQFVGEVGVVGGGVGAAADVEPLDHDGAVEVVGVGGPAHEHPGSVVGLLARLEVVGAVGGQLTGRRVRRGRARRRVLRLGESRRRRATGRRRR